MKHGPIALVDKEMLVLAIAPKDPWYEKMISQIEQAKARGGKVAVIATMATPARAEIVTTFFGCQTHPGI
jgi:glucosamine--fructose-6-phosphate aminotransferase (isomerizing)